MQFGIPARLQHDPRPVEPLGRIRCEIGYAMTSKYAIALYEMICLRSNLDHCLETIDMQRFRDLLGVPPGTYDRADNFMRNVVLPATREVNGLSDTGVGLTWCVSTPTRHTRSPCAGGESRRKRSRQRPGSGIARKLPDGQGSERRRPSRMLYLRPSYCGRLGWTLIVKTNLFIGGFISIMPEIPTPPQPILKSR